MSDIYDIIRQKANGRGDIVPPDAWDNIKRKKKKKYIGFFWWSGGSLLVMLMLAVYFNPQEFSETKIIQESRKQVYIDKAPKVVQANSKGLSGVERNETESKKVFTSGDKINDHIIDDIHTNDNSCPQSPNIKISLPSSATKTRQVNKASNKIDPIADPKSDTTNAFVSRKSKSFSNQKSGSKIRTTAAGTGELPEAVNINKDAQPLLSGNNIMVDILPAVNENIMHKEKTDGIKHELALNTPVVDTFLKKTIVTMPGETRNESKMVKKVAGKKPWFVDFAVSPVFAFQQYDHSVSLNRTLLSNAGKSAFKGNIGRSYIPPSLAFSVGFRKAINNKSSIKIGIQYLQLNEKIRVGGIQTFTQVNIDNNQMNYNDDGLLVADTTIVVLQSKRDFSAINRYVFFTVPVSFQCKILQRQSWSLGVEAGLNLNVFTRYKNHINRNPDAPLVNVSQRMALHTKIGYAIFAAVRFGTSLNKRVELFALPSFSYSPIQQYIKNTLVNKKIHLAGIGVGISYQIK